MFQQIEFLVSMKLFASWSFNAVKKLFLVLDIVEYKKNKPIYIENDSPDYMYIIKSGEFKVLKSLNYLKKPDTLQKEIKSLEYQAGNYAKHLRLDKKKYFFFFRIIISIFLLIFKKYYYILLFLLNLIF